MLEYKRLLEINKNLNTTNIKGKEYAEVNQRILGFRKLFENGSIETEIVNIENGVVIIKAIVKDNEGKIIATGTAYEKEGSTFINKTSYIENCETSAVGRALGMLGIGADTSIASAEEVQNAMIQQETDKNVSKNNILVLQELIKGLGEEAKGFYESILKTYKIQDLTQLKIKEYTEILLEIKKIKGE